MSAPASACETAVRASSSRRGVVADGAVLHHAAVAVARVLAEAHVGDDEQVGHGVLHRAHRLLHDAVLGVGLGAARVLLLRDAEQQHGRDAHAGGVLALLDELVDREAVLARASARSARARRGRGRRRAGRRSRRRPARSRGPSCAAGASRAAGADGTSDAASHAPPGPAAGARAGRARSGRRRPRQRGDRVLARHHVGREPVLGGGGGGDGADGGDRHAAQPGAALVLGEQLGEVPRGRRAGERHGVDRARRQRLAQRGRHRRRRAGWRRPAPR